MISLQKVLGNVKILMDNCFTYYRMHDFMECRWQSLEITVFNKGTWAMACIILDLLNSYYHWIKMILKMWAFHKRRALMWAMGCDDEQHKMITLETRFCLVVKHNLLWSVYVYCYPEYWSYDCFLDLDQYSYLICSKVVDTKWSNES